MKPYDWRWILDPHPVWLTLAALLVVLCGVMGMIIAVEIAGGIKAPIVWRYGGRP